ncbi:MAG: GNAT family N-acetyltransferase [Saprospiraceae bacterium]|nr:GNAT family N-acetyltransferase [Saprospiraceae bacterium]
MFNTGIDNYFYRSAVNEDGSRIREIIFTELRRHGLEPDPDKTDKDLYDIETYYQNDFFGVIVNAENVVLGSFALAGIDSEAAEIRKMYLDKSVQKLGLGKWMLTFLIAQAKSKGFSKVELESASVLRDALKLYKAFGFKEESGINKSLRCDIKMKLSL